MKVVARELLWFFIAALLAVPIAVFFSYLVAVEPNKKYALTEEVFEMELFLIGGIIGFVGVYFIRVTMWAVVTYLTGNKK